MSARVYLDHNATSPLRPEAARCVSAGLATGPANASSVHAEGRWARAQVEEARAKVAALAGLPPGEIVFTSGGSEAIAAAVSGVCERAPQTRRRIVVSSVEHSAVLESVRHAGRRGFTVEEVPCGPEGRVDADVFASRLAADVALAALQWANNETGVLQPVREIGEACAQVGAAFLVDAVQAAGKVALDPHGLGVHLLALSAHKLGGPQGVGALGIRDGVLLSPLIHGGAQERRRRGGTEPVLALSGFGAAAETALARLSAETARLTRLRARIETRLRAEFSSVRIHGEGVPRLANTINFAVPGVPGETLVIALDLRGFAISTGSACASGAVLPSHVLRAMGVSDEEARSSVRLSLGWSTGEDDVERFLAAFPGVVAQVRKGMAAR